MLKRRIVISVIAAVAVLGWMAIPAMAHEEDAEADVVGLVEQALAIVVNTPEAAGEALERVEAALAAVEHEPTDELDVAALRQAADALEAGDLHEAEDALVLALGADPHLEGAESNTDAADDAAPEPQVSADPEVSPEPQVSADPEVSAEPDHGLTDRVEGGFSNPSVGDVVALVAAAAVAAFGLGLALGRRRAHS